MKPFLRLIPALIIWLMASFCVPGELPNCKEQGCPEGERCQDNGGCLPVALPSDGGMDISVPPDGPSLADLERFDGDALGQEDKQPDIACVISSGGVEACDGVDNDCDGDVDGEACSCANFLQCEDLTCDLEMAECRLCKVPEECGNCKCNTETGWWEQINGCPFGMAPIPGHDVCIDRFEASGDQDNPVSLYNALPLTDVSKEEAHDACTRAGKRLCTAWQWKAACTGGAEQAYPYGDEYIRGRCNDGGHDVLPAGTLPECVSSVGVYDLSGNVGEWVADLTTCDAHECDQALGGWYTQNDDYDLSCESFASFDLNDQISSIGFRCCCDRSSCP